MAKGNVSWDSVSWDSLFWADLNSSLVSWADVSWSDVSWADVSWPDISWADVSWNDERRLKRAGTGAGGRDHGRSGAHPLPRRRCRQPLPACSTSFRQVDRRTGRFLGPGAGWEPIRSNDEGPEHYLGP